MRVVSVSWSLLMSKWWSLVRMACILKSRTSWLDSMMPRPQRNCLGLRWNPASTSCGTSDHLPLFSPSSPSSLSFSHHHPFFPSHPPSSLLTLLDSCTNKPTDQIRSGIIWRVRRAFPLRIERCEWSTNCAFLHSSLLWLVPWSIMKSWRNTDSGTSIPAWK